MDFINSPKFNEVKTNATPDVRQAADDAGESIWYDAIQDLKWEIQDILMVLRPEFVGDGRGLDRRIDEMDLELQSILLSYFDTL